MENCVCDKACLERLCQLIKSADGVIVSGHRGSDFDTIGSAYGFCLLARSLGKPAFVTTHRTTTVSGPLIDCLNRDTQEVLTPQQAEGLVTPGWIALITDTNRKQLLDCPKLINRCRQTVIFDHHRRTTDLTDREGLFFCEEFRSSCSEMAAIMLNLADVDIPVAAANALLAGMMLDTGRFTQKTNSETLAIASRLCAAGADPSLAYDLFDCDLRHYRDRSRIVNGAKITDGAAIAVVRGRVDEIRVVASQAANELLTIRGVTVSFVVYRHQGLICISARSGTAVDVSEIMESMGGGGNRTMAAAQLTDIPLWKVTRRLRAEIAQYRDNHSA